MQGHRWAMTSAALGISFVGAGVAVSDRLTEYPVLSAQAIRYGVGGGLLYVVSVATGGGEPRLTTPDWVRLVALALTGMVLFNVAVVEAVNSGEPAVVGTVIGLAPVGVGLLVPALERRRPRGSIVAGAILASGGAALVQGFGDADRAALCWSGVALCCEVAFTVLAAPLLRSLSPLGLATRACGLASVMLLAAATLLEGSDGFARPDAGEGFAIGYLAVASTAVAFVLWYRALARLGAERTGLFAGLMPISAALVGAAVTATSLRTGTVIGTLVTGTGVAVGLRSRRTSDRARVESTAGPRVRL